VFAILLCGSGVIVLTADQSAAGAASAADEGIGIGIDADYRIVKTGDKVLYNTTVTNKGTKASRPLVVAMNIVNLNAAGDIVDPEDWSPQRTQYIETIPPGGSVTQSWRVNAILDGNYLVYMVLIPEPDGKEATSRPIASSGIHLTVTPFTKLNPGGVLPYAIGGPVILAGGLVLLYRSRRKRIDMGGED
jgi:hypothetical protein